MPILQSIQRIIVAPVFGVGEIDVEAEAAASPSAKPFRYAASRRRFSSPFAIGGILPDRHGRWVGTVKALDFRNE